MDRRQVLTLGHSSHPISRFVELLRQHGATVVADVRSVPYSRMHPQFSREALARALKEDGIGYVFLGNELGARSDDPSCYENGKVQYCRLAKTPSFRTGLERVLAGSQKHRIVLMCAEREPLDCHRTLLVSRELEAEGVDVVHILADGSTEEHGATMRRLQASLGIPEQDLFRTPAELLEEAYALQEARIAYVATAPTDGQAAE